MKRAELEAELAVMALRQDPRNLEEYFHQGLKALRRVRAALPLSSPARTRYARTKIGHLQLMIPLVNGTQDLLTRTTRSNKIAACVTLDAAALRLASIASYRVDLVLKIIAFLERTRKRILALAEVSTRWVV